MKSWFCHVFFKIIFFLFLVGFSFLFFSFLNNSRQPELRKTLTDKHAVLRDSRPDFRMNQKFNYLSFALSAVQEEVSAIHIGGQHSCVNETHSKRRTDARQFPSNKIHLNKFPQFNGDDPAIWISCAKQFFEFN